MIVALSLAAASSQHFDRAVIAKQAESCGLPSQAIDWAKKADGSPIALINPHGDLDSVPFRSFTCLMDWGQKNNMAVGFVSAPANE